jgi:chitinase
MFQKKKWIVFILLISIYSCSKKSDVVPPPGGGGGTTTPTIAPPPSFGFYVVGYFPSYRDPSLVPDNKFKMCNVVNYAFATVSSTGGLVVQSPSVLTTVRNKAKTNAAKIFISISGSTTDWKNMASTSFSRTQFVKEVMNTIKTYALDGVDIDWEFPSTSDGTDITYTSLMKELSDSCHTDSKYYLNGCNYCRKICRIL